MKLKEDLVLRKVGEDFIIVDPGQDMVDMSKVFTLNKTAAFLWNELQGQEFTVAAIVDVLLENYEVSPELATQDAEKLQQQFRDNGLLTD